MSRDIQESTPTAAPKIDKSKSKYKRILLKLSGEALMGEHDFGIDPKVAMISYSTGQSGSGADVDKVRQATSFAKAKIKDFPVI